MLVRMLMRVACVSLIAAGYATALGAALYVDCRHPQADDANPGTLEKPFKTIGAAAAKVSPGDRVVIATGIYREAVTITTSGTVAQPIVFMAAPAAHVVITGADQLSELQLEPGDGNVYSVEWPHRFITWNKTNAHPKDDYHRLIGRSEQVIVSNYLLRQVLTREKLARGTFFVDLEAKRLYLWDAANRDLKKDWGAPLVEASSRTFIWRVEGEHVHTRGMTFRFAANMAQHGAVTLKGPGDLLEDCVVEQTNSKGAAFSGPDITVRRCIFRDNGQLGFGAGSAHRLLFTECLVENNNTKMFSRGWEAGSNKLAFCRGAVLEKSRFLRNHGNGVWFDIGNEECVVRNCLIADNDDAGIFYEISYSLHAHDNVIVGNGHVHNPGAWGANGGISLSSSPDCVIERNILLGNREGVQFREQNRTTPRIDDKKSVPIWNHDNVIQRNLFARNRDNQVGGWFDGKKMHHWPQAMQKEGEGTVDGKPAADMAAAYKAGEEGRKPENMTLEGLRLSLLGNVFHRVGTQKLVQWGTSWHFHKRWDRLADAREALGILKDNVEASVAFADALSLDLRVPADSPALTSGCYPEGSVPGVRLGVHARPSRD
ncbi:MAG: hypothetical protein HOJ57_39630 [Lentisphaerae bacterium]|jgi:hypothetical protein|nr:hypothetical protein [Lentisphaerota bacterium]MBT4819705.1 hypothetical protein [Lentisphaerota bacterium]MBT5612115.1 hypothetical protein [Lentisphaerota bacterium]MBT7056884.1 hypothetical protein [Lentisphaerota bacterium]